MPKSTRTQEDIARARSRLIALCPVKTKVYGLVRHVARSGMSRDISFFVVHDGTIVDITRSIGVLCNIRIKYGWHDTIVVRGCGMDMIGATTYEIGRALYPDGFDTTQSHGVRDDGTPRYWRNTPMAYESDGGFALEHQSL